MLKTVYKFRYSLLLLVFGLLPSGMQAQVDSARGAQIQWPRGSWTRNHIILSFGIGNLNVNPFIFYEINNGAVETGTTTNYQSIVYHAKAEFAFSDHFGFVLSANHGITEYDYAYYYTPYNATKPALARSHEKIRITTLNLRINYHFFHAQALDPYIGAGVGLRNITFDESPHNKILEPKIPFGFELTLGLRYLIASRFGIYAEAGLGRSIYQVGVSVNIGRLRSRYRALSYLGN